MSTQDPRPQDPGLETPGPRDPGPKTQDPKTWDPGTLNFFIELQNKTLKSKKSLASKRDNAKDPFLYFMYYIIIYNIFYMLYIIHS